MKKTNGELGKEKQELIKEVLFWKEKRKALIIAHNYQLPEIQNAADFIGDSLELSRIAKEAKNDLIVFCGVHFMAETASILSPKKKILIPDPQAGCSLAASIDACELRKWKKRYPDALVVSYVNTTAEVKAQSDYCVTSTNAVKIVNSLPADKPILFLPDMFLGDFVAKTTGRKNMIIYPGECHVHGRVKPSDVIKKMDEYPKAEFLIHPECGCVSACMHYLSSGDIPLSQTKILSTGGMMKYVKTSKTKDFVIATETGILYRMKKENPQKNFIPLRDDMVCRFMKMITLPKLLNSLKNLEFEVKVPKSIADRARIPIERMLELSS